MFGIVLVIAAGGLEFAYRPSRPCVEVLGWPLRRRREPTLDELTLRLHLDEGHWSADGRQSVHAIVLAHRHAALLLVGVSPLGLTGTGDVLRLGVVATIAINLGPQRRHAPSKGKPLLGIPSVFIPTLGLVGAIRLANRFAVGPPALPAGGRARGSGREARFAAAHDATWNRLRDAAGQVRGPAGGRRSPL